MLEHVIGGAWGDAPGTGEVDVTALGPSVFAGDPVIVDIAVGTRRFLATARTAARSLKRFDIVLERGRH